MEKETRLDAQQPKMGLLSATLLVIANMIGAGVFGITGELAEGMKDATIGSYPSGFVLLMIWLIGGVIALCGALSYGEVASRIPRSGGEYHFLTHIYHPALGFMSGFVSLVVGFAAAIAGNAHLFATYISTQNDIGNPVWLAAGLIVVLTLVHALSFEAGVGFQNIFAILKVGLIALFIVAGIFFFPASEATSIQFLPQTGDLNMIFSGSFAMGLVGIFYAYLGWNATVYVMGEIKEPRRTVPLSLVIATISVMSLYLLLNYVFLRVTPLSELSGEVKIGYIAAGHIFGAEVAEILSLLIGVALVSSVSSMIMAGPRVTQTMAEDYPLLRLLGKRSPKGGPIYALLLQMSIALAIVFTGEFWTILQYIGFTLTIFSALTVIGVYLLRFRKEPEAELDPIDVIGKDNAAIEVLRQQAKIAAGPRQISRTLGYPITPAIFLIACAWMVYNSIIGDWKVPLAGLSTLAIGFLLYIWMVKSDKRNNQPF
jgi:basic amino acid/polyamine antiporter, APA family